MTYTLATLAKLIGAQLVGDETLIITKLSTFDDSRDGDITFVSDKKLLTGLAKCQASAIVLPTSVKQGYQGNALFMDNPYVGYAKLATIFDNTPNLNVNIASSAHIDETAIIGNNVAISENVVIGAGVEVGDNCQIFANVVISEKVKIKQNSKIYPNVTIYHRSEIGERCIIHANSVIGSDGFGNAPLQGKWVKIPQIGRVIIGDDVEIGASTTIDRGALSDTILCDGVKIDNQCQIAHNSYIGEHTAMAGTSSMAGSTTIGKHCLIGGGAKLNGHINITDNVIITGNSMVVRNIKEAGVYSSGTPAVENKQWRKNTAYALKIESLFKRVKQLEKKLQEKN